MSEVLYCGLKFRTFNVIDDYNREALVMEPSYALPATKVIRLLDVIISQRGCPEMIRVDNGPEFTSNTFRSWAKAHNIAIHYIQPGKPAQNGLVERFNRTYREDVLDMNMFSHLQEVRAITKDWLQMYNEDRPHESLAGLAPMVFAEFRKNTINLENSIFK
jgi:putative transposase